MKTTNIRLKNPSSELLDDWFKLLALLGYKATTINGCCCYYNQETDDIVRLSWEYTAE